MIIEQQIDNLENFQRYLDIRKLSKSTQECYIRYYKLFKPIVNELGLSQEIVETWLIEHKNHKQIRAFIWNYIEFLDNREIRLRKLAGRTPIRKRKIIPPEDADNVIAYLYEHKLKYGILLAIIFDAGLRRSEALTIKPEDFDWARWFKNKSVKCRLKVLGKGNKERIVLISPTIMESIQYYANNYTITEGKPLIKTNRTTLLGVFHETCQLLLNKKYRLHDLRRSKATEWFAEGKTLEQIKIRLGHDSVKTTEIYVQPDETKELNTWENE